MTGASWAVLVLLAFVGLVATVLTSRRRTHQLELLLADTDRKLEQLQRQFERFIPADVVERLTEDGGYAAQRRQVTMLFADLRGFTTLCDRLDPGLTVVILNDYFQCMSDAIAAHHGHITELVGDGLLALFGALEPNPWQCRDAVLAALEMRAALERYNVKLQAQSLPALRFGIGIHTGEVVAGVMGTLELSKFSVTGDPINVASRVEGLTREQGVDLLITDAVRSALDARFRLRPMSPTFIRGKSRAIDTYYVEGIVEDAAGPAR